MPPNHAVMYQGPQSTGSRMENALLEYPVGQTGGEHLSSFSSAQLILAVTALNIPEEDQGVLHLSSPYTSAKCSDMESSGANMKMGLLSAAAWYISMVSVVVFLVLQWFRKKKKKKSPAVQALLLKPILAAHGLPQKQNSISMF